jgi:ribosome-associated protein
MTISSNQLKDLVEHALTDIKAKDITSLPVSELTTITDYMVVCTGTSSRHLQAIADTLVSQVKAQGLRPRGIEGEHSDHWILVDLDDVIVHIMTADTRAFYDLESLWTHYNNTDSDNNTTNTSQS